MRRSSAQRASQSLAFVLMQAPSLTAIVRSLLAPVTCDCRLDAQRRAGIGGRPIALRRSPAVDQVLQGIAQPGSGSRRDGRFRPQDAGASGRSRVPGDCKQDTICRPSKCSWLRGQDLNLLQIMRMIFLFPEYSPSSSACRTSCRDWISRASVLAVTLPFSVATRGDSVEPCQS